MTGHTCPNCGATVECDKRLMGVGRKHKAGWKPNANHMAVLDNVRRFDATAKGLWRDVPQIRGDLNYYRVVRKGRRSDWWDEDVQNLLSDLVGEGYVEMRPATRGPAYVYRLAQKTLDLAVRAGALIEEHATTGKSDFSGFFV